MYSAGCAIISRYPISNVQNVKFGHSFPVPRKGFLSARVSIAPGIERMAMPSAMKASRLADEPELHRDTYCDPI